MRVYTTRSSTNAKQNYAKVEKCCLWIVFACKIFFNSYMHLYGQEHKWELTQTIRFNHKQEKI